MEELKNWREVTRGLYRYVIAAGACYEIHILYHDHETNILTAKASLFVVGDWHTKNRSNFFERECLLSEKPVFECLKAAKADYDED